MLARLDQASAPPEATEMAFMSVAIDRAYTALEAAFVRIARELDGAVPAGEDWHAALLHQMTLPIQDRRAEVLAASTAAKLDPLRRHRHWLRHAYASGFSWPAMQETARALPGAIGGGARGSGAVRGVLARVGGGGKQPTPSPRGWSVDNFAVAFHRPTIVA